jgi:hypothetical protein
VSVLWLLLLAAGGVPAAAPLQPCDRIAIRIEAAGERDFARGLGDAVCAARRRFEAAFGWRLRRRVSIRVLGDMAQWRRISGHPWYMAAALVGETIVSQPPRSLRRLDDPARPLVHELAHLFIRRAAGRGCARWLDEGLAQWLAGDRRGGRAPADRAALGALERRLGTAAGSRAERRRDYAAARALVGRLVRRVGLEALLAALPRLRLQADPLELELAGRPLGAWLFTAGG